MCFYLLDVRIPKKVANILKKIISDKNTPEIVQNFYDHQVLLGYKNSRTMCFYMIRLSIILIPSGQINQKSYPLSHQVLKILFLKFHYIPALLSAHGKSRGEPCVSCHLSIRNQLWCHPVPSFPGHFRLSTQPEVPEATGYAPSCSG